MLAMKQDHGAALNVFTTACGPKRIMIQALGLVRSVRETSARPAQPVHLHVLHDGDTNARGLLSRLVRMSAHGLLPHLFVSGHQFNSTEGSDCERLSRNFGQCAALRLCIPLSRKFTHMTSAIYLDGDTLVRRDLRELVSLADGFNSTQWLGMARECPTRCWYTRKAEGEQKRIFDTGLNTGVMLFRLDRWRASGLLAHQHNWPANSCHRSRRSAHWPPNVYTGKAEAWRVRRAHPTTRILHGRPRRAQLVPARRSRGAVRVWVKVLNPKPLL